MTPHCQWCSISLALHSNIFFWPALQPHFPIILVLQLQLQQKPNCLLFWQTLSRPCICGFVLLLLTEEPPHSCKPSLSFGIVYILQADHKLTCLWKLFYNPMWFCPLPNLDITCTIITVTVPFLHLVISSILFCSCHSLLCSVRGTVWGQGQLYSSLKSPSHSCKQQRE